ncbi:MAG: glycerophosphodiester phosphodiesterase family protein [Pseudomonadota bacterium]
MLPLIHGHRGARGRRPENTLAAVAYALESGVDGIEIDVCVSRDNIVVVHHDLHVSGKTAKDACGNWLTQTVPVRDLDFDELKTLDVGSLNPNSDYALSFKQQTGIPGERIPSLTEFISFVVARSGDCVLNVELKGSPDTGNLVPDVVDYVTAVIGELLRFDIINRTFLQSFDWRLVAEAKRQCPGLKTGLLTDLQPDGDPRTPVSGQPNGWTAGLDLAHFNHSVVEMISEFGADVWSCNFRDISPELIHDARKRDLEVYVWTANEPEDINRMLDWGVDVITTDYPDRCRQLRDERRQSVTKPPPSTCGRYSL